MATDNTDDLIISISTDQATLRRSIKRIESDLGTLASAVKKQFDAVGRTVDTSVQSSLQNRINAMVGIGTKGAKEWTGALADQGKELERLRARYSPLFNTINNYKSAVADIRQAHALGAISSSEMAAAISRERQAALAATAAIKGRNAAIADTPVQRGMGNGSQSFNTSNLAAQGFDVAATAAFMPWYTVALQQGPQVAQVFNDIRGSGAAIGPAVAGAFMQIVNPVSLVTIGVIGATAALIQYLSSAGDVEDAKSVLEGHAALITRIREAWPEAADGIREYQRESRDIVRQDAVDKVKEYRKVILDLGKDLREGLKLDPRDFGGATFTISEVVTAVKMLDEGIKSGQPDLRAFVDKLVEIENQTGTPENIREILAELRNTAKSGVDAQRALEPLVGIIDGVGEAARQQVAGVAALSKALQDLSGIAPTQLTDLQSAAKIRDNALSDPRNNTEAAVREIENAYIKAVERINNQNPTVINSDGNTTSVPIPGQKPITLGDKPAKASRGSTRATASDRFTADIQALRDRSAAIQQEMQLIGLSNQQQVERRTALDLEQSALRDLREEARRKGQTDLDSIKLSPEKIATIQAEAAAYAKQAEALRVAQEQQQSLIEWNGEARNATRGFIDNLINGEGAAKAFANGLSKIGDALLDDVLDAIFKVNGAAGGGGGLIGQLFGSIFGGGSGFKANTTFGSFITNGFSSGGYTGPGGANDVAGLVHKDEVVFSKADVARNGGVAATEALRLKGSPTLVVPTAPALTRQGGSTSTSVTYAPNIDARGADSESVARLERVIAKDRAEFASRVVKTVQNAQGRRAL